MDRQFDFLMPSVNFFGPGVIAKIGDRAKMLKSHWSLPKRAWKRSKTAPLFKRLNH